MIIQVQISETLVKTYSDKGMMIHGGFPEWDYAEVIDPIDAGRVYTETNIPIPVPEAPEGLQEAAEYLIATRAVAIVNTDEAPDYFHENEPEPDYFG